jgi:hypothetical protein
MVAWLINDSFKRSCKGSVVSLPEVLSQYLPANAEGNSLMLKSRRQRVIRWRLEVRIFHLGDLVKSPVRSLG